jgi:predicted lipoprotein with Yx(FWY)xxD motif
VTRSRPIVALMVVGAIAISGCGSGDDDGGTGKSAVVSVGPLLKYGPIIVTSKGITLYEFRGDKGAQSECYGNCKALAAPLVTEGEPRAKGGAIAAKLGTTERKDGTTQVTYEGRPLYTLRADEPHQARAWGIEMFNAKWYPLRPSGKPVELIVN